MALASDAAASRAAPGPDPAGPSEAGAGAVPQAPEELIETQLRAILEATGTSAGAVCLFDQHQELLRLAVEVGLSDEGCRRLRSVRRGAATTWDMPLHSLLNRRVYLIESAAKNRYVPPLVEDVAAVRAVACVPLYDGATPVGSLILVALAPRGFGERQVRALEQPARQLVTHIVAMRKRVIGAGPSRVSRPGLAATAGPVAAAAQPQGPLVAGPTTPRLAPIPQVAQDPGAPSASSIQATVDRARVELERLRARVAEAEETASTERARAAGEADRRRALEGEVASLRQERDGLARSLAEQAGEAQATAERLRTLDAALDEARATEAALRAEVQRVHEANAERAAATHGEQAAALETALARVAELESLNATLEQRIGDVETAAKAAVAEATARAEAIAAAADARVAASSTDTDERVRAALADADDLRARLAKAEAALADASSAASQAEAGARAVADLRARLAELEERLAAAAGEAEARVAAAVAERDARHAAELAEWQQRCDAAAGERGAGDGEPRVAGDATPDLDAERRRWDTELAAVREREAELEERLAALQAELDRARTEDDQIRDGFAHLESLIQTGVESGDVPTSATTYMGSEATAFEVVELDAPGGEGDESLGAFEVGALDVEELGGAKPVAEAAPAPVASAAPPEGVVVLDTEEFWTSAAPAGTTLAVLAPVAGVAAEIAERNPERIVVNLGAPGALAALAAAREAGVTAPFFAGIVLPGQPRGVVVGRLDLAPRPIDPDALLAGLQGVFARGTRVVTAGADVDGLISLRQALARLGVSVSMAWDAKQAGDLLTMVHPEVAIIDLELPPKDGCALVARMGLVTPPPFTIVIPKAADTAATFAAALAHPELGRATLPAKELLARLLALPAKAVPPASGGRR